MSRVLGTQSWFFAGSVSDTSRRRWNVCCCQDLIPKSRRASRPVEMDGRQTHLDEPREAFKSVLFRRGSPKPEWHIALDGSGTAARQPSQMRYNCGFHPCWQTSKHSVKNLKHSANENGSREMGTPAAIDQLLRMAIEQRRLIRFTCRDKPRIVELHDYGIHKGAVKLLGYQVGGLSREPLPNWRWVQANSISDLDLVNHTFPGRRPKASGKHHQCNQIFIRVKPPEEEGEQ
jgi:hypothetical protein